MAEEEKIKKESKKVVEDSSKKEEVKETKEVKKEKKVEKKEFAVARGLSLRISPKHSFAICKVLKKKSPEMAVKRLEAVVEGKRSIPMAGLEVAHQKGKGVAGARFPKNACKEIIPIVKQLGANASVAGLEDPVIVIAKADRASAPYRRAGRRAKRTHLYLEAREKKSLALKKSKESKK